MNNLTITLSSTNQVEFNDKCAQLQELLENKRTLITVWQDATDGNLLVARMPKPTGCYNALTSCLFKPKECRFSHISHELVSFFEKNIIHNHFEYNGDLISILRERWVKNKSISQRLDALYRVIHPSLEAMHNEIRQKYKILETELTANHQKRLKSYERQESDYKQLLEHTQEAVSTVTISQKPLANRWKELRNDETLKDCTIHCKGGKSLKVHSFLINSKENLSKRKALFPKEAGLDEEDFHHIHLESFSQEEIESLLDYLYQGVLPEISVNRLISLYKLADYFCFEELEDHCLKLLNDIFVIDIRLSYQVLLENWEGVRLHVKLENFLIEKVTIALYFTKEHHPIHDLEKFVELVNKFYVLEKNRNEYRTLVGALLSLQMTRGASNNTVEDYLKPCADKGYAPAQFFLARFYYCCSSLNEALTLFQLASAQEYPPALCALGCLFGVNSTVLSKDLGRTYDLHYQAAKLGFGHSQYELYDFYTEGDCVEKNPEKALTWLKKAAYQGLKKAIQKLKELEN